MLHRFHKISALIIGSFVLFHLANHLCIVVGVQQHIDFMDGFRLIYRNVIAESILLLCILFQIGSGLFFVWRRRGQRSGFFERAQALSGLYLAFFFLNHVGAVLFGRLVAGLDTNIHYGIAGFHVGPFYLFFVPYYFLAVVSLFVHIASAFNWLCREMMGEQLRLRVAYSIVGVGVVVSGVLMLGFGGGFYEIQVPTEYRSTYE